MEANSKFSWAAAMGLFLTAGAEAPKGEIVGGKNVGIAEAPWQMLFKKNGSGVCGAAWLGGRWVVTAAHCVGTNTSTSTSFVWAGITRFKEATSANRIPIKRVVLNPNNQGISQDLALIELAADITSTAAKPIRYATPADVTRGLTDVGVACMASGWGKLSPSLGLADSLQRVDSKIHSTRTYVINWAGEGGTTHIGSCQGDSGGPLVVRDADGQGWVLAGISSFITSFCGDPKSASGYARVSAIAGFISQHVQQQPVGVSAPEWNANALFFPRPDRFRLGHPQNLELTVLNPAGAVVRKTGAFYAAGEHQVFPGELPAGAYVLRITGEKINVRRSLGIIR